MPDDKWRITVDQTVCEGRGICAAVASEFFEVRSGISHAHPGPVDPDEGITDAAESCPNAAISVLSAADGTLIAPEP
ncbi:ferredoxin [Actinomadura rupiterrae]|uniref:ferredoxin n=1 Tax=Actinomadura rupiterrae TaxID=559627 RepID=UPI0020A3FDD1|nr:ferredoxin [Actinomadura rupiterrae]MCP2342069.1 ferredoxin [Actinomadura rupiterrae]